MNGLPTLGEDRFEAPTGYKTTAKTEKQVFTTPAADGRTANVEMSDEVVTVSTKGHVPVQIVGKDDQMFQDLKDIAVEDAKDPIPEKELQYEAQNTVAGVGHVGKMMSVASSYYWDAQGPHPDYGMEYKTFDVRTGTQVHLDDVLSPAQFKAVVEQVEKQMKKIDSEYPEFEPVNEANPGELPRYEDYANQVRDNFALVTAKDGRQYIRVGWESGVHVMGDTAVRFTFSAPTDAAFEQKIGSK